MKLKITLLILFTLKVYCQNNEAIISYKMGIAEDEIFQGMPKFMQEELRKDNENKTFTLYFK